MKRFPYKRLATLAFLVVLYGCTAPENLTVERKQADRIYWFDLPDSAKNVIELPGDKGWHTFDLEIDGVTHHYLRHHRPHNESMVEIQKR